METFKLIIAGGRDFDDYPMLVAVMTKLVDTPDFEGKKLEIISGMAKGADALGYMFAHRNKIPVHEFHARWDKFGKSAGPRRNMEMAAAGDGLLAFWDGDSKGTGHMIEAMKKAKKPVYVVSYER